MYNMQPMSDIHVFILFSTLAVVAIADIQGLRWVTGRVPTLNLRLTKTLHLLVYAGLAGMITTGLTMFLRDSEYLLSNPAFLVKMCFVAALVINSFVIGSHMKVAIERPFAALSAREKAWLIGSGLISGISWISAMLIGFSLE